MSDLTKADLAAFGARLDMMEKWLERVSVALEKLADNRERILGLEIKVANLDLVITDVKKTVATIGINNQTQDVQLARLDMVKAAALFIAGSIITIVGTGVMRKLGW